MEFLKRKEISLFLQSGHMGLGSGILRLFEKNTVLSQCKVTLLGEGGRGGLGEAYVSLMINSGNDLKA